MRQEPLPVRILGVALWLRPRRRRQHSRYSGARQRQAGAMLLIYRR